MVSHKYKNAVSLQAIQIMSKAYTNITFGKMFNKGTEYGLYLINNQICRL